MMLKRSVLLFVVLSACSIRFCQSSSESYRNLCRDASVKSEAGLIVGGEVAPRNKWPWLVALFVKIDNKFICAGSLISERFVLTAAHCIQSKKGDKQPRDPKNVNIYLGKWNLSDATEQDVVLATPAEFIVHHDWNFGDTEWDADIAIVKLADIVIFSRSVQPVCLWTSQMQPDEANDGGIVVGWGKTEVDGEHLEVPYEAEVLRIPIEDCNDIDGLNQIIPRRALCVRENLEGACSGNDDGGGFFSARGGKWILRGIKSASRLNAAMECDAIFSNVLKFIPWIDQVLDGDEQIKCGFGPWYGGYTCYSPNAFTRSDTKIFQVTGSHNEGKTNADVRRFYTENNQKLKFLPITLGRFLPDLKKYYIKDSGLEQISRNNFADLPKLTDLLLTDNALKVIPVDVFYDLTQLKNLWLYGNEIEAIDSSTFIHNTQLDWINIERNIITSLDSSMFRNNLKLDRIIFSHNPLTSIGLELLTPLKHITEVNFSNCKCINKSQWKMHVVSSSEKEEYKAIFASKSEPIKNNLRPNLVTYHDGFRIHSNFCNQICQ